jgi:solute carrier family 35 (GDP-fucose transporter), member C1
MTAVINLGSKVQQPKSEYYVATVFSFYIATTITMVVVNKLVLKQASLPVTFLWGQMVLASIILQVLQFCGLFKIPSFKLNVLKNLVPLIGINVVGLGLNTLCLQYSDAMMYQIARSLVLPITIALTPLLLKDKVSLRVIGCCLIILVGFGVGLLGEKELRVSLKGIIFGVLSSLSTALHAIIIKQAFSKIEEKSPFDMIYYNNVLSALILLPLLGFEAGSIIKAIKMNDETLKALTIGIVAAGTMGLLVNFASFLQIKVTSPLTHTVASAARGVLQSIACYFILGENINLQRGFGIAVTLSGTIMYSLTKIYEKNFAMQKIVPLNQEVKLHEHLNSKGTPIAEAEENRSQGPIYQDIKQ